MQTLTGNMHPQSQAFSPQVQSQPRLLYFISRSNGVFVPLIPADELPFNVRLQGVSRVLTLDQTPGMQHVATAPYTGLTFNLEHDVAMQRSTSQPETATHSRSPSNPESKHFLPPDALARLAIANCAIVGAGSAQQTVPRRPLSAQELPANWRTGPTSHSSDKAQAVIDAIVCSTAGAETAARIGYPLRSTPTPPPSGNVPNQDKKEYCTHWIRTGECDYMQQGCLYKHEMPSLATLKKIGFRGVEYPRWWAEKNQTIRIGGEKASVGPIMKPSEWLNQRKESTSDNSNDADASSDSEADSIKSRARTSGKTSGTVTTVGQDTSLTARSTQTTIEIPMHARKLSDTGDLIDFASLGPKASTTTSYTPPSSADASPAARIDTAPMSAEAKVTQEGSVKARPSHKIFVPAGESPEKHVAESKKRNQSGAKDTTEAPAIDKQIQSLQKMKYKDMMASIHAPAAERAPEVANQPEIVANRLPKVACRVRRPVSSNPTRAPAPSGGKE